jgi:hypothetical protein
VAVLNDDLIGLIAAIPQEIVNTTIPTLEGRWLEVVVSARTIPLAFSACALEQKGSEFNPEEAMSFLR